MEVMGAKILGSFRAAHPNARYEGQGWGPDNRPYTYWVAKDAPGAVRLEFYEDGVIRIISTWGSSTYYDKWEITPDGAVRYLGSCEEPRYPPSWLDVPGLIWLRREVERA